MRSLWSLFFVQYSRFFLSRIEILCLKIEKYAILISRIQKKSGGACNIINSTAFELSRSILADSRGLGLNYYETMDEDLSRADCGIRASMMNGRLLYGELGNIIKNLPFGVILSLKDSLLLNYVLFRGSPDSEEFFTVSPFRSLPYEQKDFQYLRNKYHLPFSKSEELQAMLQPIPSNIMRTEALAVARNILLFFYDVKNPVVWDMDMNIVKPDGLPLVPSEDINVRAKQVENAYMHESKLLGFITEGNYHKAIKEAEYFMQSGMVQRLPNAKLSHRSLLYSANTLFRKASQGVGIHPVYLDDISKKYAQKLSLCVTHQQMNTVYVEMIEEYCTLCRNYSNRHYSRNVQKIIDYILFNLGSNLTPDEIAQAVNFSSGYISRKFREETGMSLMFYITQQRIQIAKRLLQETHMSIKEISIYIGIPDWNYFTKLFKKSVGLTPTEYKKQLKNQESIPE